jgi:RecB family exonuclease
VALCGAFEGALPAGPGADSLLDDSVWRDLKSQFPEIDDVKTRIERADMAARRAIASAANGSLTWSCPRFEPGGTREYYPSYLMVAAVQNESDEERVTASMLRRNEAGSGRVRSVRSPMTGALTGAQVDEAEGALRDAVRMRQSGGRLGDEHPRLRPVEMLRQRRSAEFTEWDGNVSALKDDSWLELQRSVSPTSLENYAVCGYRYFCRSVLHLNVVEEPEEREMMDPAARGSLVHEVLDRFFRAQKEKGRPTVKEAWTENDLRTLMRVLDDVLQEAEERGLTGLDIYAEHEARTIRADLAMFLQADTAFRRRTGAVPSAFEAPIPETDVAGIKLRGYVDRIDTTEDGREAWVIDYKTGSSFSFDKISAEDPLVGGTKLQLPTYLAAVAGAEQAQAIYWFITRKGGFKEIPYEPTPAKERRFRKTLEAILDGIRSGVFPAVPSEENEFRGNFENCLYCDFDRICSRRRDYELAAKSDDPGITPWTDVADVASADLAE